MAVTKLLRLKEGKGGYKSAHLKNNLKYILNPEKTEGGMNVGGSAGLSAERAFNSMMENKRFWWKEDGSQGFHYVLSFSPDEKIDIDLAHKVAEDFARMLLDDEFLYVYAIHSDKKHLHIHITFDSVSRVDGHKFHSPKGDWERRIQPITDEICQKYGLTTLIYDSERTGTSYAEWKRRKEDGPVGKVGQDRYFWSDIIRDDIDEAIQKAATYEEFIEILIKMHYRIRDGKYLSLKPYGKGKAVRSRSLGSGYGKEEINERILNKELNNGLSEKYKVYGDIDAIRLILFKKRQLNKNWHLSPFQKMYYLRWKNTCLIRRPDLKGSWRYRKNVTMLREISNQLKYLLDEDIRSIKDLSNKKAELEKERKAAGSALNAAKTKFYKNEVCRLIRQRMRLMEKIESGIGITDEVDRGKILKIEEKIKRIMPLLDAQELFEKCRDDNNNKRLILRRIDKELRSITSIEGSIQKAEAFSDTDDLSSNLTGKMIRSNLGEEEIGKTEKEIQK